MFGKQHSEEYVEAYRAGFHDGADCKQNFKLRMLGYEVGELLKIIREHEKNKEEKEKPAFEIINDRDDRHFKIWANGEIEGFPKGCVIINRIPQIK